MRRVILRVYCAAQSTRADAAPLGGGVGVPRRHSGSKTAIAPCPNIPLGWPCPWAPRLAVPGRARLRGGASSSQPRGSDCGAPLLVPPAYTVVRRCKSRRALPCPTRARWSLCPAAGAVGPAAPSAALYPSWGARRAVGCPPPPRGGGGGGGPSPGEPGRARAVVDPHLVSSICTPAVPPPAARAGRCTPPPPRSLVLGGPGGGTGRGTVASKQSGD